MKCYNERMKNTGVDIEKLLRKNKAIQIRPQGYSMYPFLVPGRDEVIIESVDPHKIKRGDVILYRRTGSILVLHRVYRHDKTGIYMVGDNQTEIEGPIREEQVKGILVGMVQNGKYVPVSAPVYRIASRIWLRLRIFRPVIGKTIRKLLRKNGE